jgi:hypothetical protein
MAEEGKEFSQLDLGGVLRSAHEDKNKALRVTSANTSVPAAYSRVVLTYNSSDSVTNAKFYEGTFPEIRHVTFVSDVASSLNNTYFTLHSENDESLYHCWYNVGGAGTDPAPIGSCGIEIPIAVGEDSTIVKLATQRCLEQFIDEFKIQELAASKIKITNTRKGLSTDSADVGTGFTITTEQQGEEKLVKSIDIPFDGKSRYIYNTQEKRFENYPITSTDVSISGEVDIKNPDTLEIINTTIALKNTEKSIVLPDDTKRYEITVRNSAKINLAFGVGETTTKYKTIKKGNGWDSRPVDLPDSTTIYVLSDKDSTDLEIIVWKRT